MIDVMFVQAHYTDLSKEDIADAYETLMINNEEFLSDTPGGTYLRNEALNHFKHNHPECDTVEQMMIYADLEDDVDVKNACMIKIDAKKYAESFLKNKE